MKENTTKTQNTKMNDAIFEQMNFLAEKFNIPKGKLIKKLINYKYMDVVTGHAATLD